MRMLLELDENNYSDTTKSHAAGERWFLQNPWRWNRQG